MAICLVTGAAGFIGYHLAERLLSRGDEVVGIDNLNDYYDVQLKEARLAELAEHRNFGFEKLDLANREGMESLFRRYKFDCVVNMAAQAGVRYSLTNPHAYVYSNLVAFINVLEGCRYAEVRHLVFASSSSVYGANTKMPFSVSDNVDHPVSLYAATKKSNELMAHSYAHLYDLPCTGLRFFSVYGPWGRPDMALFKFTKAILAGEPIEVFNDGKLKRDFTYIDDIIDGVEQVVDRVPTPDSGWNSTSPDPGRSSAPYRLYNIGNHNPVELMHFIEVLEKKLGRRATIEMLPMQPGDVPETFADVDSLVEDFGFKPSTSLEDGIGRFVDWYQSYYSIPVSLHGDAS